MAITPDATAVYVGDRGSEAIRKIAIEAVSSSSQCQTWTDDDDDDDDDTAAYDDDDDDDDDGSGCPWAGDGWCDSYDDGWYAECNTATHDYDGGDCCYSTCFSADYDCGSNGYTCVDPSCTGTGCWTGEYAPTAAPTGIALSSASRGVISLGALVLLVGAVAAPLV